MPGTATVIEYEPLRKVTWLASALPGLRARHSYTFESLSPGRCRFGSWEVLWGELYEHTRRFWLAHLNFVCNASISGAQAMVDNRAIGRE